MNKISGIENVILDLDGTVLLHSPNQVNKMFRLLDLEPTPEFIIQMERFWTDVQSIVEHGRKVTWEQIHEIIEEYIPYLNKIGVSPKKWLETMLEADDITLVNGVYETLDYLKSQGYNIIACTNWFRSEHKKKLERFNILSFFDEIYGWDVTCAKPNKGALGSLITEKTRNEYVIIGDSIHTDIIYASNVGIKSILYNPQGKIINSFIRPTIEIVDFIEIKNYL